MTETDDRRSNESGGPDDDDQDLAALFKASNDTVPDFLHQRILSAAHNAVSTDDMAILELTPNHESSVPTPVSTPVPMSRRWRSSSRWMAMAAAVMLAVIVAPLMLHSPKSMLENRTHNVSAISAEESVFLTTDSLAPAADPMEFETGPELMQESLPQAFPLNPVLPAIQTQKRSSLTEHVKQITASDSAAFAGVDPDSDSATDTDMSPLEPVTDVTFRGTPQNWIAHIRQLHQNERYDDALAEYRLFRHQYPNHEPEFSAPLRP